MHLIIYNSLAGKGNAQDVIGKLCEELDQQGVSYRTIKKHDFTASVAKELFQSGNIQRVIICGGDGTINRTINELDEYLSHIEIGIVPCGYGNLIAKSLQNETDLESFLSGNSTSGSRHIKVAQANNQYFINVVSVGSTADTVFFVEKFRNSYVGSVMYRVFGGIATHMVFFLMIQLRILFLQNFSSYPSSKALMRTSDETAESSFSIFTNIRDTIGQYKSLYLPGTRFIPWSISCSPVTSNEYVIENQTPFYWQIDGEPQGQTRSLKIDLDCRRLNIQTILLDRE